MFELPAELVALITISLGAWLTWIVVEGFKGLSEAFGVDLSRLAKLVAAVVSTGIVGMVIGIINVLLGAVPEAYVPLVQSILALLVSLFAAMGLARRSSEAKKQALLARSLNKK